MGHPEVLQKFCTTLLYLCMKDSTMLEKEEIKERGEEKKRLKKERKREFGERKGETSK